MSALPPKADIGRWLPQRSQHRTFSQFRDASDSSRWGHSSLWCQGEGLSHYRVASSYLLFLIFFGFDFRCMVVQFFRHFITGLDIGVSFGPAPSRPGPF